MKAVRLLGLFVLLAGTLWSVLALGFLEPLGRLSWVVAILALVLAVLAWIRLPRRRTAACLLVGILAVQGLWIFQRPSLRRDWSEDMARVPRVSVEGDRVRILDARAARYPSDQVDVHWRDLVLDLSGLERLDFMVEPIGLWGEAAHTLLSFGFSDGRQVGISVEIRRQRGEAYSPLKGIFRQYELLYVVADEEDLIGLRANVRRHPVRLYPIRADRAQIRTLFVDMLRRADGLGKEPEFYNTLTNACTTNIARHMESLGADRLRFNRRVIFPGNADALAMEMGLIDAEGTLEALRARFLINGRSGFGAQGADWSRQIRSLPLRTSATLPSPGSSNR